MAIATPILRRLQRLDPLLRKDLTTKFAQLDTIFCINNGGCALVSYSMQEWLAEKGVKSHIVYLFIGYGDLEDYENLKNNRDGSCAHSVLKIGNLYYDSSGESTYRGLKEKWGFHRSLIIPSELALTSVSNFRQWNRMFNRDEGLRRISNILDIPTKIAI